jgi:arsenate reductase
MPSANDMSNITIWHNPRCSKSRQTLQLIRDRGVEPAIVDYLKTPPSEAELNRALKALGVTPRDLIRNKESLYAELSLDDDGVTDAVLVGAMHQNPILIERPVVFRGERAVVGRPPERVLALLD